MRRSFFPTSARHDLSRFSLKQLIAWGDHLKVHQPQIDAQHEAIFNLALEIASVWHDRGDLKRLQALAEKLDKILEAHFRFEERKLAEIRYPKLAEHKAEHKLMLDDLQTIRGRLDRSTSARMLAETGWAFQNFVLGLTVGHIFNSDMDYVLHARQAESNEDQVWPAS